MDFDELMVETLRIHPDVHAIHRVDCADTMGLYVVDVNEGCASDVLHVVQERVHKDLDVAFGKPPQGPDVRELWVRSVAQESVRSTKPKQREKARAATLNELIESLRETLLTERNKLIVEEEIPGETLAGYVLDVSDPCCPTKFKEMVGGEPFIKHCIASGKLPLAVGVMPRIVLARQFEPIARRVEKMPESPIFFTDAPVPKTIRILETWRIKNEMVIVTVYQKALGLKSIVVPSVISLGPSLS